MDANDLPVARLRTTRSEDGLTLAEMVVAIGIIMVVLVASLSGFITVKRAQAVAEGTDRAAQLANSRIERIRQVNWVEVGFHTTTFNATTTSATVTDAATTTANYNQYMPAETTVKFTTPENDTGVNIIKPYETTTESGNKFQVYTTITYGVFAGLGLPRTTASTPTNGYSYKRVRVAVVWRSNGNGAIHTTRAETWFAPEGVDATPPGITLLNE